jgi:hypothetical protein
MFQRHLTASIIRVIMEAVSTSETMVNFYRLHGATSQKTDILILTSVLQVFSKTFFL